MLSLAKRNALIEKWQHLPAHVHKKLSFGNPVIARMESEDARQAGMIGLCQAAMRFDPKRGFEFSTYAYYWVRRTIQEQAGRGLPLHVPFNLLMNPKLRTAEQTAAFWKALNGAVKMPKTQDDCDGDFLENTAVGDPCYPKDIDLDGAIECLPERLKWIVREYYWEGKTLKQIAAIEGVTRERIRQLLVKARRLVEWELSGKVKP